MASTISSFSAAGASSQRISPDQQLTQLIPAIADKVSKFLVPDLGKIVASYALDAEVEWYRAYQDLYGKEYVANMQIPPLPLNIQEVLDSPISSEDQGLLFGVNRDGTRKMVRDVYDLCLAPQGTLTAFFTQLQAYDPNGSKIDGQPVNEEDEGDEYNDRADIQDPSDDIEEGFEWLWVQKDLTCLPSMELLEALKVEIPTRRVVVTALALRAIAEGKPVGVSHLLRTRGDVFIGAPSIRNILADRCNIESMRSFTSSCTLVVRKLETIQVGSNAQQKLGEAVMVAAAKGALNELKQLLNKTITPEDRSQAVIFASQRDDPEMLQLLLEDGLILDKVGREILKALVPQGGGNQTPQKQLAKADLLLRYIPSNDDEFLLHLAGFVIRRNREDSFLVLFLHAKPAGRGALLAEAIFLNKFLNKANDYLKDEEVFQEAVNHLKKLSGRSQKPLEILKSLVLSQCPRVMNVLQAAKILPKEETQ